MDRTNISPYIPDSSDDSRSIKLLPKQYRSFNDALIDNHRQLNLQKSNRSIDNSASPEEDVLPSETRVQYDVSTNDIYTEKCSKPKGDIIVKVHRDGVLHPMYKRVSLEDSVSSEEATTHTDLSDSCNDWEQLANERGVKIKQLEYRIAVMQKVIRQYDRKCDKIKRIAEAASTRNEDLDDIGGAYLERGIGHEEIESDIEDHKLENTCTYMKNV